MDKTGGAAFPQIKSVNMFNDTVQQENVGMTLRDYFAGQALVGLLSDNFLAPKISSIELLAINSYVIADAMLEARGK